VSGGGGVNDTGVGPLPASGVDVAPTPGADLNPPQDQTVTLAETGAAPQLSQSTPPASNADGVPGWLRQPPLGSPYAPAIDNLSDPLAPYLGANSGVYSPAAPGAEANSFLASPAAYPYFGAPQDDSFGSAKGIDTSGHQALNGPGYFGSQNPFASSGSGRLIDNPLLLASADGGPIYGPDPNAPEFPTPPSQQWVDATTLWGAQQIGTQADPFGNNSALYQVNVGGTVYNAYLNDMKYPGQALLVPISQADPTADHGDFGPVFSPPGNPSGAGRSTGPLAPRSSVPNQSAPPAAGVRASGAPTPGSNAPGVASSPTGTGDAGNLPALGDQTFLPNTTVTQRSLLAYGANEFASTGAVRALDALSKSRLGATVDALLEEETILDNIQRVSQAASEYRQLLRASDQARGGLLNQIVSPLIDRNSGKTWSEFVTGRLAGGTGEQALEQAYREVANNASIGRTSANIAGTGARVLGGALGLAGAGLSGYALQDDLSRGQWFDATVDATSFASSGLAFGGALVGSVALTDAGLVLGSFGIGVAIGSGIDKGLEWGTEGLFGIDLSPSGLISIELTSLDTSLTSLWADPSKPAYTQTIAWKILQWTE
jgi:hypothetical protein